MASNSFVSANIQQRRAGGQSFDDQQPNTSAGPQPPFNLFTPSVASSVGAYVKMNFIERLRKETNKDCLTNLSLITFSGFQHWKRKSSTSAEHLFAY